MNRATLKTAQFTSIMNLLKQNQECLDVTSEQVKEIKEALEQLTSGDYSVTSDQMTAFDESEKKFVADLINNPSEAVTFSTSNSGGNEDIFDLDIDCGLAPITDFFLENQNHRVS